MPLGNLGNPSMEHYMDLSIQVIVIQFLKYSAFVLVLVINLMISEMEISCFSVFDKPDFAP